MTTQLGNFYGVSLWSTRLVGVVGSYVRIGSVIQIENPESAGQLIPDFSHHSNFIRM